MQLPVQYYSCMWEVNAANRINLAIVKAVTAMP